MSSLKTCWLVFDAEKKGSETQCRGLAEALDFTSYSLQPISKAGFLKFIPRRFWFSFLSFERGLLKSISKNEKPDLIISSGTRASALSAFLKKEHPEIRVINLLNPRLPQALFDLIVTPEHDRLMGENVLTTLGSLHSVTPEKLAQEREKFQEHFNKLTPPIVSIFLGGPSKSFKMTAQNFEVFGQQVAHLYRTQQASFLVSFSRRTPQAFKDLFLKATKGIPLELYDPETSKGENPYFAYLGMADTLIVSADSISMVTEACATGKPVLVMGRAQMPRKFQRFHKAFEQHNHTRPFKGSLEKWAVVPLNETQRIAQIVRKKLL